MKKTIFSTPVVNTAFHYIAKWTLKLLGWKVLGEKPALPKYVLIGAPHTSNWDFVIMLLVCFTLKLEVHWMGKHTLFPFGLKTFMSWLGGIPVFRGQNNNLVGQTISAFNNNAQLVVLIPPEGTRSEVTQWRTGFYHIAYGAQVPVVLGFMDFAKKEAGLAHAVNLTGELDKELPAIQSFYAGMRGKNRALPVPSSRPHTEGSHN